MTTTDSERTAIVEEDAAERRGYEAEQRAEVAAELTAETGRVAAERNHAAGTILITIEDARRLAAEDPSTRGFWTAYADRLDELAGPSTHLDQLERIYRQTLDAIDALLAERVRLRAHKVDLTRVHDLVGFGVSRATEARLRDADAAIEGLDRILLALRGDS